MCIAVPGEIIDILDRQAKVYIMGVETIVNIQLIKNPKVGDYVLVHAGCAIEKIDKHYFDDLSNIFNSIAEKDENRDE